ncbi:MAG: RNA-binding domain-containing protein [Ignavibacteria bacterium]
MNEQILDINQPEGRRLEFKENLSREYRIEKTAVAFSNGAGGEIYLGIKDKAKEVVGFSESEILKLEQQISNIIYENISPGIMPEINILNFQGKYLLRVIVYPGGQTPYFIKSLGLIKGTYIRVGSNNKPADETIIQELDRKKRNISFDSILSYTVPADELDLTIFGNIFLEQTGKKIDSKALETLGLIKKQDGQRLPTTGAILLASSDVKNREFPYSKIECARFKGTTTSETIDSCSITEPLCQQPDLAINFIKRNIKKGSKIKELYRDDRWEYPLDAIREIIVNAVIHRDYSRLGSDIKVAIFDDMLEITSPGTLPPSIDIKNLSSGLSEIRNRTLAPVFKMLNFIEQWGTGFKKLDARLKDYPEIEVKFQEPGISFQVQFIKRISAETGGNLTGQGQELSGNSNGTMSGLSRDYVGTKLGIPGDNVKQILELCNEPAALRDLLLKFELTNKSKFKDRYINPLFEMNFLEFTIPGKPKSPNQKYLTTEKGKILLNSLLHE